MTFDGSFSDLKGKEGEPELYDYGEVIYLLQPYPTAAPCRFKVGYTGNLKSRMSQYKTLAPHLCLLRTWPGTRSDEDHLLKHLRDVCRHIESEVFEAEQSSVLIDIITDFLNAREYAKIESVKEVSLKGKKNGEIDQLGDRHPLGDNITEDELVQIKIKGFKTLVTLLQRSNHAWCALAEYEGIYCSIGSMWHRINNRISDTIGELCEYIDFFENNFQNRHALYLDKYMLDDANFLED